MGVVSTEGDSDRIVWDVFLAHASVDTPFARQLNALLTARGVSVCFDEAVLRPGDNWYALLPRYVRQSAIVVALVSEHTDDAHFEVSEIILAINQVRREGRRLVPVRLSGDVEMPYGTEQLHRVDAFGDESLPGLVEQLVDLVAHPERVVAVRATQVWSDRVPVVSRWFTGRETLLERLGETTHGGGTRVLTQTVSGLGGVGKTMLAAAFAESRHHELDVVWWVRAEDPTILMSDLAELGPRVGLSSDGDEDVADAAGRVRQWLQDTGQRWLVVFDNAPDEASIEQWRPKHGQGSVVVTSRNRNFDRVGDVIDVSVFDIGTAERFLRDRVRVRNPAAAGEADAATVAERLGGLPLALEQAASWVARAPNRSFSRYVELYDDMSRDPFPDGTQPHGYEATALTTWRVSIDAATAEVPVAERLTWVLGYFAPDNIPLRYLQTGDLAADAYLETTTDVVDDALVALHDYSLIELGEKSLSVHRVVQDAARRTGDREAAGCALRVLRAQAPGDATNHVNWPALKVLTPHAIHAADTATVTDPGEAADLWFILNDVATYLTASGSVTAAIDVAERALALASGSFGDDHPDTLTSRNNLASAYESAGQLDKAIPLYEAMEFPLLAGHGCYAARVSVV